MARLHRRRGRPLQPHRIAAATSFTLLELLVVSVLMVGVVTITAQLWRSFSADMTDLAAGGRVAQELRLSVESISEDFGDAVGATPVGGNRLLICKDGGEYPNGSADWAEPDVMVEYFVSDGQLFRYDQSADSEIAIAESVSLLSVEDIAGSLLRVVIEVQRNDITRVVTFIWSKP